MSKFTQPTRTVRDIKTLAGKADDLHTPHKMYMRLFALETERHRRMQERASAMLRVTNIDARCAEIDQEKAILLGLLGVESVPDRMPSAAEIQAAAAAAGTPGGQVPPTQPRRSRARAAMESAMDSVRDSQRPATPIEPVKIRY
jgi:hypothetical protein